MHSHPKYGNLSPVRLLCICLLQKRCCGVALWEEGLGVGTGFRHAELVLSSAAGYAFRMLVYLNVDNNGIVKWKQYCNGINHSPNIHKQQVLVMNAYERLLSQHALTHTGALIDHDATLPGSLTTLAWTTHARLAGRQHPHPAQHWEASS